jgi:hypothetical protein
MIQNPNTFKKFAVCEENRFIDRGLPWRSNLARIENRPAFAVARSQIPNPHDEDLISGPAVPEIAVEPCLGTRHCHLESGKDDLSN